MKFLSVTELVTPLGMFLVFIWGFVGTMGLIFLTCSLFFPVSLLHFIVSSSIDTPLDWFDPSPTFYHFILCIRRFLAKSRIHTWVFGQKSRIHASFWPKVAYIRNCSLNSCVHPPFWLSLMLWEVVGWVVSVVGSS